MVELIKEFTNLSLSSFKRIQHKESLNQVDWKLSIPSNLLITKTIIAKAKDSVAVLVSLDESKISLKDIGKNMRIAPQDVLERVLKTDKDFLHPFHLEKESGAQLFVDSKLLALDSAALIAFRDTPTDSFVVSVQEFNKYWELKDIQVNSVDSTQGAVEKKVVEKKTEQKSNSQSAEIEGAAKIGIEVTKDGDFPTWYQQVLTRSEMLDYYDISGCYILRPWSFYIWKQITRFFDQEIEDMGVEPCYFPMFVSAKALEREKDHVEGFAPEVAWVTKAGSSDLAEHIAIRPTSETVMYPAYSKWIQSHRELPLRLNQWCNVVRWEFKHPQPFLRTREFLWQEGHTAFFSKQESDKEVLDILNLYSRVYEELLAVPVVKGVKSEKEKFAGGLYTTTVEALIPTTGRAIQGATSHCLGQNFSKMFNIVVEDPDYHSNPETAQKITVTSSHSPSPPNAADIIQGPALGKRYVWQNSWGMTTRTLGVMVMVHGDDKGLVLPPRVASIQVIVIPVGLAANATPEQKDSVNNQVESIVALLKKNGVRAKSDMRSNYSSGWKYNHWELKGVPIRLEVGPKDLAKGEARVVRRDNGEKEQTKLSGIETWIKEKLETIQSDMLKKARAVHDSRITKVETWDKFVPALDAKNLVLIPWCEEISCEEEIKDRSAKANISEEAQDERAPSMGAKSLCIPLDQPKDTPIIPGKSKCVNCGKDAKRWTLFGRSY